jgi:hypothetical protein
METIVSLLARAVPHDQARQLYLFKFSSLPFFSKIARSFYQTIIVEQFFAGTASFSSSTHLSLVLKTKLCLT